MEETQPYNKSVDLDASAAPRGKIHAAISKVMAVVGPVAKSKKNPQQGYMFRGIDDIFMAVKEPMSKHGIFCVPMVEHIDRSERATSSGGKMYISILTVRHRFYADDGSYIDSVTVGEAQDSGDKASNKAMSAAMKYALIEVFCIATGEKIDTENYDEPNYTEPQKRAAPAKPATPAPAQKTEEKIGFIEKTTKTTVDGKVVLSVMLDDGGWLATTSAKNAKIAQEVEGKKHRCILTYAGNQLLSIVKEGT